MDFYNVFARNEVSNEALRFAQDFVLSMVEGRSNLNKYNKLQDCFGRFAPSQRRENAILHNPKFFLSHRPLP